MGWRPVQVPCRSEQSNQEVGLEHATMNKSDFDNVDHVRDEVANMAPTWRKMRHTTDGQRAMWGRIGDYIPYINSADKSAENVAKNEEYRRRGIYYNFTGRTLEGLVGTIFSRSPIVELPPEMESLYEDASGDGVSMDQQSRNVLREVMVTARGGLLAEYPVTEGSVTRAQILKGEVRPSIRFYTAENIINWRVTVVKGVRKVTLLVLKESYEEETSMFTVEVRPQWRVLILEDEIYRQIIVQEGADGDRIIGEVITPTDSAGEPLEELPFTFIGPVSNDEVVQEPPLESIANLNIGHFRNSCDFEAMTYLLGNPTLTISGLDKEWYTDVLGGRIQLGGSAGLPLPEGAKAELLQIKESLASENAMKHKEAQAAMLGAKLIEGGPSYKTAREVKNQDMAENSVLTSVAHNIEQAYRITLGFIARYVGANESSVTYEINDDFNVVNMSTLDRQQLLLEWQAGIVTWPEARTILRQTGIAYEDDTEAEASLEKYTPPRIQAMEAAAEIAQAAADAKEEKMKTASSDPHESQAPDPNAANKRIKPKK